MTNTDTGPFDRKRLRRWAFAQSGMGLLGAILVVLLVVFLVLGLAGWLITLLPSILPSNLRGPSTLLILAIAFYILDQFFRK